MTVGLSPRGPRPCLSQVVAASKSPEAAEKVSRQGQAVHLDDVNDENWIRGIILMTR